MAKKELPKKVKKIQKVQIKEGDDKIKTIGKYDTEKKLFMADRNKSEHFMRKLNAWGLDKNTVDFLAKERATIRIKDRETKWIYECQAVDFVVEGTVEEHKDHRPQYFLHIDFWDVVQAKNRSVVVKCGEIDCKHNFGHMCLRGAIEIGKDGECSSYEDKN